MYSVAIEVRKTGEFAFLRFDNREVANWLVGELSGFGEIVVYPSWSNL